MQLTSLFTLLAVAMTASALPSLETPTRRSEKGGGSGEGDTCTNETANVCCTGGILACLVNVAGPCTGSSYCCSQDKIKVSSSAVQRKH